MPLLAYFQIYTRLMGLKRNESEGSARLPATALALIKQSFQACESIDAMKGDQTGDWSQPPSEIYLYSISYMGDWCGREDSNFHGSYPTATSTLRVYQFRHDRT